MPISEKTRREIIRSLRTAKLKWSGDLEGLDFLERVFDLDNLPSTDHRFENAKQDIYQHTVNNDDWLPEWVYTYEPFNLLKSSDVEFLRFLCEMINPQVRSKKAEAEALLKFFNENLALEGYQIIEKISSFDSHYFEPMGILPSTLAALNELKANAEKLNADHLNREIIRMQNAIDKDPELAIGTAKEFVETVCKMILTERKKTFKPTEDLPKLVFMTLEETNSVGTSGIDKKVDALIRRIIGNMNDLGTCMAELRNLQGTGHGKAASIVSVDSRHAALAVNVATTLGLFLFQSHEKTK